MVIHVFSMLTTPLCVSLYSLVCVHMLQKQVAFGSFDNNDQQDDRTFNRSSTSHESAIENGAGQRADTQATTHHTEQGARPSATNNADLAEVRSATNSSALVPAQFWVLTMCCRALVRLSQR